MIYVIIVIAVIALLGTIVSNLKDSPYGKIILIAAVVAIGLALLGLLFDWNFLFVLAKVAIAVIIVTAIVRILVAIFSNS